MAVDYYKKYLKYKAKYLELKNQIGEGKGNCSKCTCGMYNKSKSGVCMCGHREGDHYKKR